MRRHEKALLSVNAQKRIARRVINVTRTTSAEPEYPEADGHDEIVIASSWCGKARLVAPDFLAYASDAANAMSDGWNNRQLLGSSEMDDRGNYGRSYKKFEGALGCKPGRPKVMHERVPFRCRFKAPALQRKELDKRAAQNWKATH